MQDFTDYDSFEEMMQAIEKARISADAQVKPTQEKIKPGQFFINMRHGSELPIFGEVLETEEEIFKEPHMKNYRFTKAFSKACPEGEMGDTHVSEIAAIIDPMLFEFYQNNQWDLPARQTKHAKKISKLLGNLAPLAQHSNIHVLPHSHNPISDTLNIEIIPRSSPKWAKTAFEFANHQNIKYDQDKSVYGIDGQPRVSYSGMVWVRYLTPFEENSKIALQIWSQQPSHSEAEEQLSEFYSLFQTRKGMEPIEVFKELMR